LGLADRARQRQPKHGTFNETRSTAFNAQLRTPNTERKSAGRLDIPIRRSRSNGSRQAQFEDIEDNDFEESPAN